MLPSLVLKRMLMGNFPNKVTDKDIADSVDFCVERVSFPLNIVSYPFNFVFFN